MQRFMMSIMLLALSASPVQADGDCPDRPAPQQERAAYQALSGAAKAAVPPAPADWVLTDETPGKPGTTVPDCPGGPHDRPMTYALRFTYAFSAEASQRMDQGAVGAALKGTPEQQAKMVELDRKIAGLEEQKQAARKSRDAAEKERVRQELKTARKERNKITDEITNAYVQQSMSGQLAAEMNKNKPVVREAQLVIKVNEQYAWIPAKDQPVSIPGVPISYWFKSDTGGRLVMLLGPWDNQTFKMNLAATPVKTRPQGMVIEITGDRQMAESLARQIRINLLKKQL